jgi:transposase
MEKKEKHSKEFKLEAVRLLTEGVKTAAELAMELGVKRTLLYRWKDQLEQNGEDSFKNRPGRPRKDQQSEIATLRQELKDVKEERDILKKAAAYFARDLR